MWDSFTRKPLPLSGIPFNSLCEIQTLEELERIQFLTSFNSLCEIHREDQGRKDRLHKCFQFSLWDSLLALCKTSSSSMPFNSLCEIRYPWWRRSVKLLRSTFNSLCEIRRLERHKEADGKKNHFQFSLWDSIPHPIYQSYYYVISFNSLCEIQIRQGDICLDIRWLSILFVRFIKGATEGKEEVIRLSILFVRFGCLYRAYPFL